MYFDVIIAGFGGQGVLLLGNLLTYGAMEEGRHVTYMPVYGVEMRGGTANCTVVISDQDIGSPVIHHPVTAVVMNKPSLLEIRADGPTGGLAFCQFFFDRCPGRRLSGNQNDYGSHH